MSASGNGEDDSSVTGGRYLAALGLSDTAEEAYRRLLNDGAPDDDLRREDLDELERFGLVVREREQVIAMPPRLAVTSWARRQELKLAQASLGADLLTAASRREAGPAPSYLEFIPGDVGAKAAFSEIQSSARHEICGLDRGSYLAESGVSPEQPPSIDRGVRYKVVYHQPSLRNELTVQNIRTAIGLGEEARVCRNVPIKMLIADRSLALLVLHRPRADGRREELGSTEPGSARFAPPVPGTAEVDGLLVHPSAMLDCLVALFDVLWDLSIPMSGEVTGASDSLPAKHADVLRLLAAGLTDGAIARELSISERTVQRRVEEMQKVLGAGSRFLLGAQAARRGWL